MYSPRQEKVGGYTKMIEKVMSGGIFTAKRGINAQVQSLTTFHQGVEVSQYLFLF